MSSILLAKFKVGHYVRMAPVQTLAHLHHSDLFSGAFFLPQSSQSLSCQSLFPLKILLLLLECRPPAHRFCCTLQVPCPVTAYPLVLNCSFKIAKAVIRA